MTRFIIPLLACSATSAWAGPNADQGPWIPEVCDCSSTADALQDELESDLDECRERATDTSGKRPRLVRALQNHCMESRGWRQAESHEVESYGRFCALVQRLETQTDDDPEVVAAIPNPQR